MKRPDEWTLPLGFRHELVVDNFAGGGGASTGIEQALGRPIDIAINHDPEAIAMHQVNHPGTQHYCESVYKVDPEQITGNQPVGLAWFSPDCKHFSKAKGGAPVSPRVRGLAWVVVRWARRVKPRVIMLENVEEFQDWGPLRADGMPDTTKRGKTFQLWVNQLRGAGYAVEWKQLRACDYGAPTIRKRLFVIARRDGRAITWPKPTHGKGLLPYATAAQCIDWSIPCPSIFERERPLAENTMRRIARGIKKYVIDAAEPFIVTLSHGEGKPGAAQRWGKGVRSVDDPLPTLTASNGYGVVVPYLTEHANASAQRNFAADEPMRTQVASVKGGHFAMVAPTLVNTRNGEREGQLPRVRDIQEPAPTVTSAGSQGALVTAFMAQHNTGMTGHHADAPLSTLTGRGTQQQLVAAILNHQYSSNTAGGNGNPADPIKTITTGGHAALVHAFLLKYYGSDQNPQLLEPMHTVTTKERFGLVTVAGEEYQIVDIGMRMLTPRELYRAQGFPADYRIDFEYKGKPLTKTAQVRMCGNSVCPPLSKTLVEANFVHEAAFTRAAA